MEIERVSLILAMQITIWKSIRKKSFTKNNHSISWYHYKCKGEVLMDKPVINILMVDDRPENLQALEAVLGSSGYQLTKAYSGEEALKWLLIKEFAIILLDVQMPGLDGFETAKLIRSRKKSEEVPIIFITALTQTQDYAISGYSAGAIDFLFKPFNPVILRSKVEGFVKIYETKWLLQQQNELLLKQSKQLDEAHSKLEQLVEQRTQQLRRTNESLQREIQEKQTALKLAQASESKYKLLVEESPMAIFILELHRECWTFINQTGIKMLGGQNSKEITSNNLFAYIHPDDHAAVKERIQRLLQGKKVEENELRYIRLDGEIIHAVVTIIPFDYFGNPAIHIVARDITELKKTSEYISQSEKLSVVGELAAGIAHEIRNPLTSLRGFTQLLESTEKNNLYTPIMLGEIDRVNSIVSELLLLSKPTEGEFNVIEINELLNNVVILMNAQAILQNIEIKLHVPTDEKRIIINGLENKLKQVFINLLKNAMEAMETGGEIKINIMIEEGLARLEFQDHGCGIPEDILSKIGQPFFTTKEKGTGLGLMVCKSIIDSHDGQMTIQSESGIGTTITLTFPLCEVNLEKNVKNNELPV
ncbi:response regulator [Bacillus sp. BGMRC 2118]|nr:response regulator [Bacillus sp. BGMRC 2118]